MTALWCGDLLHFCRGTAVGQCMGEVYSPYAKARPRMDEFAAALKVPNQGGVEKPDAESNQALLQMFDMHFPELSIYRDGQIQTSPGTEEIKGSPTEYYRTVGAMIALLAAYIYMRGDEQLGLEICTGGNRGPMSKDKVPGKFINMGNKPEAYRKFCQEFDSGLKGEEDWWAMMVFLAIHDVGKSNAFRMRVNQTLKPMQRTDDHDRVLANALRDPELLEELLPSVCRLGPERIQRIADGFATNFQLPQLGQGEIPVISLAGLIDLPKARVMDGTLRTYLYHSIFDIAGAACNEKFIWPLAILPVYSGFQSSMLDLVDRLSDSGKPDSRSLYFDFLNCNFKKAYPDFEENTFKGLCDCRLFRDETGLVMLRILALTRNTYKNTGALLSHLSLSFTTLVNEMAGNVRGPQVMLYYGPDMLRMGLGTDLEDESGDNMRQALGAMDDLYGMVRERIKNQSGDYSFELNVNPIVLKIKEAGDKWKGGAELRKTCAGFDFTSNAFLTQGIVRSRDALMRESCC